MRAAAISLSVYVLVTVACLASCTKENAAFCCLTVEDCATKGVDELRSCADGLACVSNTCVAPTCTSSSCGIAAPVCDTTTDQCVGCSDSTACSIFATTPVCDPDSGACVECTANTECDGASPICDAKACRACRLDSECPSGACDTDGSCVAADSVAYVAPGGVNVVPCTHAAPCLGIQFAIRQTSPTRRHVVLAQGVYSLSTPYAPIWLHASQTTAPSISIHGGGSVITGGSADGFFSIEIPTRVADLELMGPADGVTLAVLSSATALRMKVRGQTGISVSGSLDATDIDVAGGVTGIRNSGVLTLSRSTIHGGTRGIVSNSGTIDISNTLVYGTSETAMDLGVTNGRVEFSTIAHTGPAGTYPPGLGCAGSGVTVRASIIWAPVADSRPAASGSCTFVTSIVGPVGVSGALNTSPNFVNPSTNDYPLSGGSSARDLVDTGPALDLDGEKRPQGARFDIGADEAP